MQITMQTQSDIDTAEAKKRKDERLAEILTELDAIDKKKVRPLSVVAIGKGKKEDIARIEELEARADILRKEYSDLKE